MEFKDTELMHVVNKLKNMKRQGRGSNKYIVLSNQAALEIATLIENTFLILRDDLK